LILTIIRVGVKLAAMKHRSSSPLSPIRFMLEHGGPPSVGIKRALLARVGQEWKVGDRVPPIRELARLMAVSPNNVQLAVRELAQEGVLFSRKGLGLFVRALPSDKPAARKKLRSTTVALAPARHREVPTKKVVIMGDSPHLLPAADAMAAELRELGLDVLQDRSLIPDSDDPFFTHEADAVVLVNPCTGRVIRARAGQAVLIINSGAVDPIVASDIIDRVGVDQEQGGTLAGRYLRQIGCESACFVGVELSALPKLPYHLTSIRRLRGFEAGWGATLPDHHWLRVPFHSTMFGARAAMEYAALSPRPRGIFVACDDLGIGLIHGLTALGLEPGRDYQLIGFDGSDPFVSMAPGAIASVRVPAACMGRLGAQLLMNRLADPHWPAQSVNLACDLPSLV